MGAPNDSATEADHYRNISFDPGDRHSCLTSFLWTPLRSRPVTPPVVQHRHEGAVEETDQHARSHCGQHRRLGEHRPSFARVGTAPCNLRSKVGTLRYPMRGAGLGVRSGTTTWFRRRSARCLDRRDPSCQRTNENRCCGHCRYLISNKTARIATFVWQSEVSREHPNVAFW